MRYNTKSYPNRERNDCSVRALAAAAGVTYTESYKAFTKAGRKKGRGVYLATMIRMNKLSDFVFERVLGKPIGVANVVGTTGLCRPINPQPTLHQFVKKHPTGAFLVTVKGHALAVRNGIVIDSNRSGSRCRVDGAWKVQVASTALPWYWRQA